MKERLPLDGAEAEGQGAFNPAAAAGLFVGVSSFEDERIHEVPFAVDDAVDLAHLFTLELGLITPEHIVLLLAGEPRKSDSIKKLSRLVEIGARREIPRMPIVLRFLTELPRYTEEHGIFVFTAATHGVSDRGGDFLVASDSRKDHILRAGLAVGEIFDEVAQAGAGRRLVLLDACRERLSRRGRGRDDEGSPMTQSFANAIGKAKGTVVLSGATLGGFAYDDLKRQNGVFTAAVLEGLRGAALAESEGWITVSSLANFVQESVVKWVRLNRPDHAEISLGIGQRIEGPAGSMPLALHPETPLKRYRARREAALALVRQNLGGILRGEHWDRIVALLPIEGVTPEAERLLNEIQYLDGSEHAQRSLRDFLREEPTTIINPLAIAVNDPAGFAVGDPAGTVINDPAARVLSAPVGPVVDESVGPEPKKRKRVKWWAGVVAVAVLAGVAGVFLPSPRRKQVQQPAEQKPLSKTEPAGSLRPLPSGKPENRAAVAKPADVSPIGLSATAKRVSPGIYNVLLAWKKPTSGMEFWIVRSRLDGAEEVRENLPSWAVDSPYLDTGVMPMARYQYTVRVKDRTGEPENVEITVPCEEFKISGHKKLAELKLPNPLHRLIFQRGAELLTEGHNFEVDVIELIADNASIRTFADGSVAKAGPGRPGGSISISAERASGKLTIVGIGERGGKGPQGPPAKQSAGEGQRGTDRKPTGVRIADETCMEPAEPGGQGKAGEKGSQGETGYPGGDSARIKVWIKTGKMTIKPKREAGLGGKGGDGGPGQQGGPGGKGGQALGNCPPGETGPVGANGPPGEKGLAGTRGKRLPCCVKIGGKTLSGCTACAD